MAKKITNIPIYLKNPLHRITVNVIGCGGTGSLVVPRLARMDYALKMLDHPGLEVTVYDDDIVEETNVGRQNFSDADIGLNKALVMVEKCNLSYGLGWTAIEDRYNPISCDSANITMFCVDNVKSRKEYYDLRKNIDDAETYYPYTRPYFAIDGGNGKDFGQVVISDGKDLKDPFQLFPEIESELNESEQGIVNCSYFESLEKQDLFINDEIALQMCKYIWEIFRDKEIKHNAVIINQTKNKKLPL